MATHQQLANAIRVLAMDAVQQANSGHPGMPMGMADIAEVLWNDFLSHNPSNPQWPNRDRFILSNGHGSMLHYALLHLTGYELSIDDLKNFRQLHSKTPGHPELGYTPGVETTTGPLGQGIANGVGMAIAERTLAAQFNRQGFPIIDHYTYVFAGDGCMMEGISHEACSFAGTLGLEKLIVLYDDNGISIDGKVEGWFTDNTMMRFQAYGWNVIADVDGHDRQSIKKAIEQAKTSTDKPTLIICKTIIAHGAAHSAGTSKSHGSPLGEVEIAATREALKWPYPPFTIPMELYMAWDAREKGNNAESQWTHLFNEYQQKYPECAAEFTRRLEATLPNNWSQCVEKMKSQCIEQQANKATRQSSQDCLDAIGPDLPELLGGSADLTGSNNTFWSDSKTITKLTPDGNYLFYGVREFAMAAIMNGIAVHGGFIPYGGTFLVFSDYARNAIRLSAFMKQRVIYVLTHDSIGLGEDGPTHQPVEHAAMLRITPNMSVWRPCDTLETAVAWQAAIEHTTGPSALLLTRQTLPYQSRSSAQEEMIARGGYVLRDSEGHPELILIATGSEVALAVEAYERLSSKGYKVRVVSMPNSNVFLEQDEVYQKQVLPVTTRKRIAIEAAASNYWYQFVGLDGKVIGLTRFGESAPGQKVFAALGFTVENILAEADKLLQK